MRNSISGALILTLLLFVSCGKAQDEQKPAEPAESVVSVAEADRIYFDFDISDFEEVAQGDEIMITLDDGTEYTLLIQRSQETIPGMLSIAADIGDKEFGQAALIYRDQTLRGSFDLYVEGVSYQINFDSEQNRYFMSPRDEDILEGSEPLTPPGSEY